MAKKPSTSVLKQAATPEDSLVALSVGTGPLRLPKGVSRDHFIGEVFSVYELLGGQTRFLLWADEHPTEFYKMMMRTMPTGVNSQTPQVGNFAININVSAPPNMPQPQSDGETYEESS